MARDTIIVGRRRPIIPRWFATVGCLAIHLGLGGALAAEHAAAGSAQPASGIRTRPVPSLRAADAAASASRPFPIGMPPHQASPELAALTGQSSETSYGARIRLAEALRSGVHPDHVAALYEWLALPTDPGGLPPHTLHALKNRVVDILLALPERPDGISRQLVEMAEDPDTDPVWRDYCLQFLGTALPAEADPALRGRILDTLWAATSDAAAAIAGTALLALSRNLDAPELDRAAVAGRAREICGSPAPHGVKATALQVAARLGEAEILPFAREWAAPGTPVSLRMSALAALGALGNDQDLHPLKSSADDPDARIRHAARNAITHYETTRGNPAQEDSTP